MGTLISYRKYLEERWALLDVTEQKLLKLQQNYESHLAEIRSTREAELDELLGLVLEDRSALPEDFNRKLDEAAVQAEKAFEEKKKVIEEEKAAEMKRAEEMRQQSLKAVRNLKARNRRLDREEEELKARVAGLLPKIEAYNAKIAEMGHGFGFFSNLFKMRRLADQRDLLEKENAELEARIELLRSRWKEASEEHVAEEADLQKAWRIAEDHALALAAKMEALETRRGRIIARSALEIVLRSIAPEEQEDGDRECPRCRKMNDSGNHFCWACAQRLQENDPGFEGSVVEMAELNHHFQRFSKGVHACRGIIALVRGLKSGLKALSKSVSEMIESQDKYASLGTLDIDVPGEALTFGEYFDRLSGMVDDSPGLHPLVFADRINILLQDRLTEEQIKGYFERMGEELSRQAKAQWE